MQAKKDSDKAQKVDYAKMNKEYGAAMALKSSMSKVQINLNCKYEREKTSFDNNGIYFLLF